MSGPVGEDARGYWNLRIRGEGDVAHTVEIRPGALMIDVDEDGLALGVELIGSTDLSAEVFAILWAARFPVDTSCGPDAAVTG